MKPLGPKTTLTLLILGFGGLAIASIADVWPRFMIAFFLLYFYFASGAKNYNYVLKYPWSFKFRIRRKTKYKP
jgi:hypothetical protein